MPWPHFEGGGEAGIPSRLNTGASALGLGTPLSLDPLRTSAVLRYLEH